MRKMMKLAAAALAALAAAPIAAEAQTASPGAKSQTLAAHRRVYRDLPNEQRVGASGRAITGNETYQLAVCVLGRDGGVGEVGTLQQVAVHRVGIQRLAACYQIMEGGTVAVGWATERYGRNTQNKSFGVVD